MKIKNDRIQSFTEVITKNDISVFHFIPFTNYLFI
jgi:hypothetical protein